MLEALKQFDRKLFLLINGCNSEVFDNIMVVISGKFSWIPFYAFLLYLLIRVIGKNIVYAIPIVILLITLSDQGSVILFKNYFQRLRPCHEESLKPLVHLVNGNCGGQFGFISSHASNTMAISFFVFLFLKNTFGNKMMLIFVFPLIVSYSRIYLGIHYPSDVVCGMIFGATVGYLVAVLTQKIMPQKI
ncbi:MAG: phosphatase PAP2 family protein [Bacteroidia bacterium]